MLVENATLLLAASDFLSEASWDSMTLPTTVLCSFLLGESPTVSFFVLEQIFLQCYDETTVKMCNSFCNM